MLVAAVVVSARSLLRLYIAFRLFRACTCTYLDLAGILVNGDNLDMNLISDMECIIDVFGAFPADFGYMEKRIRSLEEVYERKAFTYFGNRCVELIADLGFTGDILTIALALLIISRSI